MNEAPHPRAEEAAELFVFLREVQRLRYPSPTSLAQYRDKGGYSFVLSELPDHPAVRRTTANDTTAPTEPILVVDRLPPRRHPEPPAAIAGRVVGKLDTSSIEPRLELIVLEDQFAHASERGDDAEATRLAQEIDGAEQAFSDWLPAWTAWAQADRKDRPVRELYRQLASAWDLAANASQDWEILLGIGRTRWPEFSVDRCAVVWPVEATIDEKTGAIIVAPSSSPSVEDDLLPPDAVSDLRAFDSLRDAVSAGEDCHPLAEAVFSPSLRSFAFRSMLEAQYIESGEPAAAKGQGPVSGFDPVLFVRPRSRSGAFRALSTIAELLRTATELPDGILALVDPDLVPTQTERSGGFDGEGNGAVFQFEEDVFLPLPINEAQRRVILRTEHRPLTLVQGPPGTGKTHTIAALVSHFLAKGMKVLITAETEQALREVRDKLPDEVRELSVAVLGSGQEEMAQLAKSVGRLNQEAADFDATANAEEQKAILRRIASLRTELAKVQALLRDAVEAETKTHQTRAGSGSLARLIERLAVWDDPLEGLLAGDASFERLTPDSKAVEEFAKAAVVAARTAPQAMAGPLPSVASLPDPHWFGHVVDAIIADESSVDSSVDPAQLERLANLSEAELTDLALLVGGGRSRWSELETRREAWIGRALHDIGDRMSMAWIERAASVRSTIDYGQTHRDACGDAVRVSGDIDAEELRGQANALRAHLQGGSTVKVDRAGEVKLGMFSSGRVKVAQPFLSSVRVGGEPPATVERIDMFLHHVEAIASLERLRQLMPDESSIAGGSFELVLASITDQSGLLDQCVGLVGTISSVDAELVRFGLPRMPRIDRWAWTALEVLINGAAARRRATLHRAEIEHVVSKCGRFVASAPLVAAARAIDAGRFNSELARLHAAIEHGQIELHRDALADRLRPTAASLVDAILAEPGSPRWNAIATKVVDSWLRGSLARFLGERSDDDPAELLTRLHSLEDRLRDDIAAIAALRAWAKAVGRLTNTRRSFLQQYVQLVKGLGKGTGKLAEQKRAGIRRSLERCRDSVPAWIMPLYRISQTLPMERDSFDVVVIDEASQAGLDALMLQYLAPRLVVVGDDKQVSPSAIGLEVESLALLAEKHLRTNPFKDSFKDPHRSLFDEAKMRFGEVITLVEHRRCVPDIIGFCNEIAYEPDGIRLIPIREPGAAALEPIVPLFVEGAYTAGDTNRRNVREAEVIVDSIVQCLSDERYDGMTFGVISLLGPAQVKLIDQLLRDKVDARVWKERQLRVGQAPEFQGSERNVIFLSLVATSEEDRRFATLTSSQYVQRFNVAVSRAKDQLWVVHSVDQSTLHNPEDLRRRLLEYAYRVNGRLGSGHPGVIGFEVSESERVKPFESRFEQRVHNELVRRQYVVVPQYEAAEYHIDLVVIGAKGKLAIECDGDWWHAFPRDVQRDLARQRELERCGWTFFRVRESEFVQDRDRALAPVWRGLTDAGIYPTGADRTDESGDELVAALIAAPVMLAPVVAAVTATIPTSFEDSNAEEPDSDDPEMPAGDEWEIPTASVRSEDFRGSQEPVTVPRGVSEYVSWRPIGTTLIDGPRTWAPITIELVDIARSEAPMSALRLFQLHRKASLGVRVAKLVKSEYVGVLITAVSAGRLALAGSTDQLETLTVWLPDRPRVSVRTRGDRTFWEVPSDEVVELFRQIDPGSTELHVLCQQVADFYGVGRTTSLIRNFLAGCVRDAREPRLAGRSTEHAGPLSLAVEVVAATRGLSIERVVPPDALAYADRLAHPVRKRYARVALTAWAAAKPLPRPTNENESIVADRLERWGVS